MEKSICIVQTAMGSSKELSDLCAQIMPEVKVYQIIDDSMLPEMLENSGSTPDVNRRLFHYYEQAQSLGIDAILHQCVVAGDTALLLKNFIDIPIVRIDEGMLREALSIGDHIAVLGTAKPAMKCSISFLKELAAESGKDPQISEYQVTIDTVSNISENAAKENDVLVLSQPSMTAMLPLIDNLSKPVLSAPELGVRYMKKVLEV